MALACFALVGCGGSNSSASGSKSTLTICEDDELSGAGAIVAAGYPDGGRAEVDHLNASGGVLGHPLKLVVLNNQSTPSLAASVLRECVDKYRAWAVAGFIASNDAVPAIPVANELHELMLTWASGWDFTGLPTSDFDQWAFPANGNIYVDDDLEAINDIALPRHYTRIALMYENDSSGDINLPAMQGFAKQYHFDLVAEQSMLPNQTDVTPEILKLLAAHPQMIVTGVGPGTDSVTFLKAVRAENATIPIGVCAGCAQGSFISAMGGPKEMSNIYSTGTSEQLLQSLTPSSPDYSQTKTDIDNYYAWMKKEGYTSDTVINDGEGAWNSVEILADAANAAHSVSPDAVRTALQHQVADTLGDLWHRTPTNYASATILGAVVGINPNGSAFTLKSHSYSS